MNPHLQALLLFTPVVAQWVSAAQAAPSWVISANESKIDLTTGVSRVVPDAAPDTVTLLNFATFPPGITHLRDVSNSVLGPPSNVALSPDGRVALIADSIQIDSKTPGKWIPARRIHVIDLTQSPPRVVGQAEAGDQPSGMSITPDGKLVLVANRAAGSISVLRLNGTQLTRLSDVSLAAPADEVSDVAISPDGRRAFVSIRERNHLRELRLDGEQVVATDRKFSAYGRPYRGPVTPDNALVLTAGQGAGNGPDVDALTVIDLDKNPSHTADFVPLGVSPESIELSPNGQWLIAVLMAGSNLASTDPAHSEHGQIVLLERQGRTFRHRQTLSVGRIPEGAVFTSDGQRVVVQCHPDRQLWVLSVEKNGLKDTGLRIDVPGLPSGLRALR